MIKYKTSEIANILGGKLIGNPDITSAGFCTDTREIKPDDCFFAIKGETFDGHDFVEKAFAQNACCAVVSKETQFAPSRNQCLIVVDDTIKALGDLARDYRTRFQGKVIAITGSVGKTSTRELIYHVLGSKYKCHCAKKSFNNNIGLPMTILNATGDEQFMILELGTNHPGEISYLTDIALPDIAIVTTVACAHLQGFGTLSAIIKEKTSIARGLRSNGVLIVNGDQSELVDQARKFNASLIRFGTDSLCEVRAHDMQSHGLTGSLIIDSNEIEVPLAGRGNLYNVLCAWALCSNVGLSLEEFIQRIKNAAPQHMRLEIIKIGSANIICDCYNANPASMANAIDCLAALKGLAKRVFICGHMGELGSQSKSLHEQLGEKIGSSNIDILLCCGQYSDAVVQKASLCSGNKIQAHAFIDTQTLCDNLHKFVKADDTILIKGSRSARLEMSLEKLKEILTGN